MVHKLTLRVQEPWRQRYRDVLEDIIVQNRHNKTALGFSKTNTRRKSVQKRKGTRPFALSESDFLALLIDGTTDKLRIGYRYITEYGVCECCGQRSPKKRKLNDAGRRRLANLRRKYAASDV